MAEPTPPPVTVESLMITDVHSITVDMSVRDAIGSLLKNKISGAPVIDTVKKVISVISQGDLMKIAAGKGLNIKIGACLASLPQTEKLVTLPRSTTFAELYRKFLSHPVHRIIIIDGNGRLQGIVSRSTVLRVLYGPDEGQMPEEKPEKPEKKKAA